LGEAQVKLIGKDDGTFATVLIDGTPHEVSGVPGLELGPADKVKVNIQTKQIIDRSEIGCAGIIGHVVNDLEEVIEVEVEGSKKVVHSGPPPEEPLKEGDRVVLDQSGQLVIRHLPREQDRQYTLAEKVDVDWEDIGGLVEAKDAIQEAIELPFQYPNIFKHYTKKPPKGVLFFGPPGCGKTLMGKATTNSLATIYGSKAISSGFIYIKGPEILNMYVGNSERNIREIFARGRQHFGKYGFPAVIFIDEADAVLRKRGTSKSSDVDKTIVPMFLSEMDGLEENHSIVILATNRAKELDPAVVREGRVDRHIKISRPDETAVPAIFKIHLRNIPLKGIVEDELVERATADIFRPSRKIFKIVESGAKDERFFTFGDCITGSMVEGIVGQATSRAIRRDIENTRKSKAKKPKEVMTGVTPLDFKDAIEGVFRHHCDLNPDFDLEDYYERHSLDAKACQAVRVKVRPAEEKKD
jgi:proteasome-associated ATPase